MIHNNAIKVLQKVMQQRNWHKNKYLPTKASGYKNLLNNGKLSYEKACTILITIGYTKVQDEVWQAIK